MRKEQAEIFGWMSLMSADKKLQQEIVTVYPHSYIPVMDMQYLAEWQDRRSGEFLEHSK